MTSLTNLSTLEYRILDRLENETTASAKQIIEEEFARFECEVEFMSESEDEIGQAKLTDGEIPRLPIGNQHTDELSLIEWQCVKAAAISYGVRDWTAKVDTSLTYEENISIMAGYGDNETGRAIEQAHMRWAKTEI